MGARVITPEGANVRSALCCAVVAATMALAPATAAAGPEAGSCVPTTVVAGDMAEVAFPEVVDHGELTDTRLALRIAGDVSDLVATLDHGSVSAAVLVGTPTSSVDGVDAIFTDAAPTSVTDLEGGEPLQGVLAPAEPFAVFDGTTGAWTMTFLNLGTTDVEVESCTLTLTSESVAAAPSTTGTASGLAATGGAVLSPAIAFITVGLGILLLLRAPRRRRAQKTTAMIVVLVLAASVTTLDAAALRAAAPATAEHDGDIIATVRGADAPPPPIAVAASSSRATEPRAIAGSPTVDAGLAPHPWGLPPAGRAVARTDVGLVSYPIGTCDDAAPCLTQLTDNPTDTDIAISPTGMKVAFTRQLDAGSGLAAGRYIHVLDLRTGEIRRLTESTYASGSNEPNMRGDRDPAWSPDEQTIIASDGGRLFTVPAAGGAEATIAGQFGIWCGAGPARVEVSETSLFRYSPQYAPDGSLYYIRRCDGPDSNVGTIVHLTTLDVGQEVDLLPGRAADSTFFDLDMAPDGASLSVTWGTKDDGIAVTPHVSMLDLPGATLRSLTIPPMRPDGFDPSEWTDAPAWSPAGTHLLGGDAAAYRPDGTGFDTVPFSALITSGDLQCSPGNCLSGFVLNVHGADETRDVVASGAVTGAIAPSVFRKAAPGTYDVTLRGQDASIESVQCDDADSTATTTAVSLHVAESEVVVCDIELGSLHDRDGDGIEDQWDTCPDDPENWCHDADRDGVDDPLDPCPLDPLDKCVPGDPDDPDDPDDPSAPRCHPFDVTVALHNGGIDWFDSSISGRVCPPDGSAPRLTVSSTSSSDIRTPSMAAAMDLAGLSVNVEDPVPRVFGAGTSVQTSSAWFGTCFSLVPGGSLGKFAGKGFVKLLSVIKRFAPDRLVAKAVRLWIDVERAALETLTARLSSDVIDELFETVQSTLEGELERRLLGDELDLLPQLCLPIWRVDITVTAGTSIVSYAVHTFGPSDWRLVNATNAVG